MRDYALGTTFDVKFNTRQFTTGAPFALAGGAIVAYADDNVVEIAAGITLSAAFDGVVGLHNIRVVATGGNGYAAGSNYSLVLSAGTVDGVSVVGVVVAEFSIEAQSPLRPTVAGRTLDVTATGAAGVDWANIENPATANNLSATNIDVDQVVASVSGAVGSVTGTVGSVTGNIGGNVTGSIGTLAAAAVAQVNAEVVDVLTVDASPEPAGVPTPTAPIAEKIARQYASLTQGLTTTAAKKIFQDSASVAVWEKDLTDDGTTYTESQGNAP